MLKRIISIVILFVGKIKCDSQLLIDNKSFEVIDKFINRLDNYVGFLFGN